MSRTKEPCYYPSECRYIAHCKETGDECIAMKNFSVNSQGGSRIPLSFLPERKRGYASTAIMTLMTNVDKELSYAEIADVVNAPIATVVTACNELQRRGILTYRFVPTNAQKKVFKAARNG